MPKILLYLLGVSQSEVDNELVDIHGLFKLDRDRGDKAFHATPSELRNPPAKRPKFQQLASRLKEYDTLVTTRAVGLGRSTVEVLKTVELLKWDRGGSTAWRYTSTTEPTLTSTPAAQS